MRILMISRVAGPDYRASPGDIIDLPEDVARRLVIGGFAEPMEEEVETAAIDPAREKAVKTKPQPRKK